MSTEVVSSCTKRNRSKRKNRKLKELKRLEKLVFGTPDNIFEELSPTAKKLKSSIGGDEKNKIKSAWEDEDDLSTSIKNAHELQGRSNIDHPGKPNDSYNSLLKRRFENIIGNPKWADLQNIESNLKLSGCNENDIDETLIQRCGNLIEKSNKLSQGTIKYNLVKELNSKSYTQGKLITAVEFHPKSLIGLVAGISGVASLFEVDGKNNSLIQAVKFPKFSIQCAKFINGGDQVIVGSTNARHFYCYDMMSGHSILIPFHHDTGITNMQKFEISPDGKIIASCGRFGCIFLICAKTKEIIGTLNMNGTVNSICFNSNGSQLYSHGDGGEVYVWDMNNRTCMHRFTDDGCLKGTSLSISSNDKLLACGSSSGIVNLYETESIFKSKCPQPLKILPHLTTPATSLKFNHSSELLAMASSKKNSSVKLMHYPSLSVYKNFPDQSKKLGSINCISFSPHSGYMALGTHNSKALLFRLHHFGSY